MKLRDKLEPVSFLAGIGFSGLLAPGQDLVGWVTKTGLAIGHWMQGIPPAPAPWLLGALPLLAGAAEVMARGVTPRLEPGPVTLQAFQRRHGARFPFLPVTPGQATGGTCGEVSAASLNLAEQTAEMGQAPSTVSGRLQQAMLAQLAAPWQGLLAEAPHRMALLALLGCRAAGDEAGYRRLGNTLAQLWGTSPSSEAEADLIGEQCRRWALQTFDATPVAAWLETLAERHSRSTTLLMAALASARRRGVISMGELGWLRRVDASLFFALDAVGRPNPLLQGVAAACHYAREVEAGRRLPEIDWTIAFNAVLRHQARP